LFEGRSAQGGEAPAAFAPPATAQANVSYSNGSAEDFEEVDLDDDLLLAPV
jgi:hypothetical protein